MQYSQERKDIEEYYPASEGEGDDQEEKHTKVESYLEDGLPILVLC
jgi:hypothetical protein